MSTPIDERTAWDLVRAVRADSAGGRPTRVHHNPRPDAWLQVHPSGRWETSSSPTAGARQLLDLYVPLQISADLTIAQAGQSLDGRIAAESGHSHYVTGPADIRRLHRLRALVDAVIVGATTVDADNPRLTVREATGENPVRVVLDPNHRLDASRLVFSDGVARTIAVRRADPHGHTPPSDADILRLPVDDTGVFDPKAIVRALRERGYRRLLVEGGGITVSRFVDAGVIDRLQVTVAPLLIGSGRPAFVLRPVQTLDEALRPPCRVFRLGNDVLFDLDLRHTRRA